MQRFCKKITFFLSYFILLSGIIISILTFTYHVSFEDLPAPNISNSFSLNDKLDAIRNRKSDIIAIGSSITLNDLSSEVVVQNLKDTTFLNIAAWGLNMMDSYRLLQSYCMMHTPRILIISSSMTDFYLDPKVFNTVEVGNYLSTKNSWKYYIKNFNLKYYMQNALNRKKYKASNNIYESLIYDKYGSVLLNPVGFQIDSERWNVAFKKPPLERNYNYLDSISIFCKSRNIKLLFFQSPVRKGLFDKMDHTALNTHISRVTAILSKNHNLFVNSTVTDWDDSLFVDAIHLNTNGANLYTQYCFKEVDLKTILER